METINEKRKSNANAPLRKRKSDVTAPLLETIKEGNKEDQKRIVRRVQQKKVQILLKMNSLKEAVTQKRWMVINKEVVFGNGIIPYTDDSSNGIIPILSHLCTKENVWHMEKQIQQNLKNVEQELRRVGGPQLL